ncbi:MAG: diguanylate cyclase [Deltaproteobacteria bacterium]
MSEVIWIKDRLTYLRRISFKKAAVYVLIPVLWFCLPLCAARRMPRPFLALSAFYLANGLIVFRLLSESMRSGTRLRFECENAEGQANVQRAANAALAEQNRSLRENIDRYASLKKVLDGINQDLDADAVCDRLCEDAFGLVGSGEGTAILYLFDSESRCLKMHDNRKSGHKHSLKAKHGDIFDQWVAKHVTTLLIEDIGRDFRFDMDRLKTLDTRPVGSLISCPLVSGGKFLGILRLDHPSANYYDLDDLRFLRAISELGAITLENALLYRSTQELATHDGLTGVFTKSYFLELLKQECRRAVRQKKQFGLLMLDIDHFKDYNDTYGHIAGDIVLKTIADRLVSALRDRGGVVGRFGGEEFTMILPGHDLKQTLEAAELLREAVSRENILLRRRHTSVTVSIGGAVFPGSADEEIGLLMKADKAMYEAKEAGRNRVVVS